MNSTYLVQRLEAPPKSEPAARMLQAFGGGNLGFSPAAWKVLQSHVSISYMGAAEYEFGAIPQCLQELARDADDLGAFSLIVPAEAIKPNALRRPVAKTETRKGSKKQPAQPPVTDREVFVLCRKTQKTGVIERILLLAGDMVPTKMRPEFAEALDPSPEYPVRTIGWLELDNGFFFFLDKEMWSGMTQLFTRKPPEQVAV